MPVKFKDPIGPEGENFNFPQSLLTQITECSNGGFLLFTIDCYGDVIDHVQFDNQIVETAIRTKALELLTSIKKISQIQKTQELMGKSGIFDDDDDYDDEDEDE